MIDPSNHSAVRRTWAASCECRSLILITLHRRLPRKVSIDISKMLLPLPIICSGSRDGSIRLMSHNGIVKLVKRICAEGSEGIWSMCTGIGILYVGCYSGLICVVKNDSLDILAETHTGLYIDTPQAVLSIAASAEFLACAGANGHPFIFAIQSDPVTVHPCFPPHIFTINLSREEVWCLKFCAGQLFAGIETGRFVQIDYSSGQSRTR